MTIKTIVYCNGLGCCNEFEFINPGPPTLGELSDAGWYVDPDYPEFQYCKACYSKVEKEIKERVNEQIF